MPAISTTTVILMILSIPSLLTTETTVCLVRRGLFSGAVVVWPNPGYHSCSTPSCVNRILKVALNKTFTSSGNEGKVCAMWRVSPMQLFRTLLCNNIQRSLRVLDPSESASSVFWRSEHERASFPSLGNSPVFGSGPQVADLPVPWKAAVAAESSPIRPKNCKWKPTPLKLNRPFSHRGIWTLSLWEMMKERPGLGPSVKPKWDFWPSASKPSLLFIKLPNTLPKTRLLPKTKPSAED